MRIVLPKCGAVFLMVWVAVGALVLYAAVHVKDEPEDGYDAWPAWIATAVISGMLAGALAKSLRRFPLTYTGGTYRVRRRILKPGDAVTIGPIENVGGRHVCFSFHIAMRGVSVRLRRYTGSARVTLADTADRHPLDRMTIVVHEPKWNWDSEYGETNWNEMATDIPVKTRSCYVVVQSCESAKPMRIRGRIAICLRLREFLHPPSDSHFERCTVREDS